MDSSKLAFLITRYKKFFLVYSLGSLVAVMGYPSFADGGSSGPGWWVAVEGGYSNNINPSRTTVETMPLVSLPDNYNAKTQGNNGTAGIGVGFQLVGEAAFYLPAQRIGLFYDYFFPTTVGGVIEKYQFIDAYNYSYRLKSNTVWLNDQLDLFCWDNLTIFIEAGIGAAFNRASGYEETPVPANPDVRFFSGAFEENTYTSFAYRLGAGINYAFSPHVSFGASYRYSYLGNAETGPSANYPTMNDGLITKFRSSAYLLTLRYNV